MLPVEVIIKTIFLRGILIGSRTQYVGPPGHHDPSPFSSPSDLAGLRT